MLSSMCPFCEHRNPPGSRFCNDCGGPLHLKPCSQCEAVNDRIAKHCHQCGAELPVNGWKEPATVFAGTDTAATTATGIGVEPAHAAESTERLDPPSRRSSDDNARSLDPGEFPGHAPEFTLPNLPAAQAAKASAPQVLTSRKFAAAGASRALPYAVVLLVAAMSAYYVYRDPAAVKWLEAHQPAGRPAASESVQTVDLEPATTGATQATSTGLDTGAAIAAPKVSAEIGAEEISAPGTPALNAVDPPAGTFESSTPASVSTASAKVVSATPLARNAQAPNRTIQTAVPHARPAHPSTVRAGPSAIAVATTSRAGRADLHTGTPGERPRAGACTQAVAALGLCSSSPAMENK